MTEVFPAPEGPHTQKARRLPIPRRRALSLDILRLLLETVDVHLHVKHTGVD
jgi:hypothetical protein